MFKKVIFPPRFHACGGKLHICIHDPPVVVLLPEGPHDNMIIHETPGARDGGRSRRHFYVPVGHRLSLYDY